MQEHLSVDEFNRSLGKHKRHECFGKPRPTGVFRIELPLPPKILHPNGRTRNYGYRAAMVKKHRALCRDLMIVGFAFNRDFDSWKRVKVLATFYLKRRQDGDNLNAWIKCAIDAMQDANYVRNDSGVTLLPPEQVTGAKERPRVVLTITPNHSE